MNFYFLNFTCTTNLRFIKSHLYKLAFWAYANQFPGVLSSFQITEQARPLGREMGLTNWIQLCKGKEKKKKSVLARDLTNLNTK